MNARIALLGQPNSGKSTVFNALTGARQHVGNWPGKTVEKKDGTYQWKGTKYTVTDLPGSYGLSGTSDEELITAEYIRQKQADLVLILVDASQLERSMYMTAEFAALSSPAVLILNMMDVARERKKEIDAEKLSEHLGIPVLPFVAADGKSYDALRDLIARELKAPHCLSSAPALPKKSGSAGDDSGQKMNSGSKEVNNSNNSNNSSNSSNSNTTQNSDDTNKSGSNRSSNNNSNNNNADHSGNRDNNVKKDNSCPEADNKIGSNDNNNSSADHSSGSSVDRARVLAESQAKYDWIRRMLEGVTKTADPDYRLSRFDRIATGPWSGKFLTVGIIIAAFIVAMIACIPFFIVGGTIPALLSTPIRDFLTDLHVHPWLVSIFSLLLPNVVYFSFSMAGFVFGIHLVFGYLEEIGFLARAAYQFDGALSRLGLHGKAICPILMGFGCTIGGASSTRVLDSWGQRMLAMAVIWAVPCAAIWSVIPVVGSMFFPAWGVLLVCIGILLYMVFMMWLTSKIFGSSLVPESARTGLLMELPPYHKPHWKHIFKEAFYRSLDIFLRALRVVTLISVLFWAFSYSGTGHIEDSLLYRVGTAIEPVTRFFGMGWQTFMAFLSSAFAKEAVLGVMNAAFLGQSTLVEATFNAKTAAVDSGALAAAASAAISPPEALAFMFACAFNVPCVMALSTTYKESHSLLWTARVAGFYIGSALLLSCVVYHLAALVM